VNKVAQMAAKDRADLFAETAARRDIAEAIIEKDLWVCWALTQLFSIDALKNRLLFKGGTSLSKVFYAINRFSEDIDLAVDYVALGFTGDKDPRKEGISKTKRAGILDQMMSECRRYIAGDFLTAFKGRCEESWARRMRGASKSAIRTQILCSFVTLRQALRISTTLRPRWCWSWERMLSLCRTITSPSGHSPRMSFPMSSRTEMSQW